MSTSFILVVTELYFVGGGEPFFGFVGVSITNTFFHLNLEEGLHVVVIYARCLPFSST